MNTKYDKGTLLISDKMCSVDSLLQCIKDKKELELHIHDTEEAILIMPFSCYDSHMNIFFNYCEYFINFSAKKYNVCHVSAYEKHFPYTKTENQKNEEKKQAILEYENDFKNRIKAGEGLITNVSKVAVNCCIKAITWDDISSIRIDECEEKIQNEYGEEVVRDKGYYFRFYTRQDVFKDEFYGDNSYKLFQIFYKDKDKNPYILWGYIDYINIKEDMNDLGDSYIQIFLKDYTVREDKAALIKQAYNLQKKDVEELEKTLLTNDCILQPLTQKSNEEGGVMLSENINIQDLSGPIIATSLDYNPNVCCMSSIDYGSVTFGDYTFSPKEVGQALKSLVDDYKTKIEENKEDKSMFNKIFDKYKFGEIKTNNIAYTINGLAFKGSDGTYAVYKDGTLTNVGDMIIDMPIFVMPTSLKSIEIGDVIVHYGAGSDVFVIVTAIDKDNITVVDPWSKERKNLIPEKSIFGFDFVAKVITPMGMFEKQANADNPFGNMLPFMMMGDGDNKDMMMLMMMSQGNINNQMLPLMFMGKGDNDMLKYMMLTQMSGTAAGTDKE